MASDAPQHPTEPAAADVVRAAEASPADPTAHAAGTQVAVALAGAVDELAGVADLPVHEHAGRYQAMHAVLQDALSATDRSAD